MGLFQTIIVKQVFMCGKEGTGIRVMDRALVYDDQFEIGIPLLKYMRNRLT